MEDQMNEIYSVINELDEMIMRLPLQDGVKQQITQQLCQVWEDLEDTVQLRSSDFG